MPPILRTLAEARNPTSMLSAWRTGGARRRVVEDPEVLGYRLVTNPLLGVMDADRWYALERTALAER